MDSSFIMVHLDAALLKVVSLSPASADESCAILTIISSKNRSLLPNKLHPLVQKELSRRNMFIR